MRKIRTGHLKFISALTILLFVLLIPHLSISSDKKELFSHEEAKKLNYTDQEFANETATGEVKSHDKGPSIDIEEPAVMDMKSGPMIEAISPVNIYIVFKKNDSALNMDTLDVWGEKFFFKKNLTSRVLPYIKTVPEGAVLSMHSIHVPRGNYKVGFSISDMDGKRTKAEYKLKVR